MKLVQDGNKSKCWLDLSEISKRKHIGKECYDWTNSIGCKIGVRYQWLQDEVEERWFEIIDNDAKISKLTLKWKDNVYEIKTNDLQRGNCGNIFDKITSNFKYKIGQTVNGLTIIDRYYKQSEKEGIQRKWYKYRCEKGHEYEIIESALKRGIGCSICDCKTVLEGYNDICTTHPHLVQYFSNIDDVKKYTYCSSKKISTKCPFCQKEKLMSINNLTNQGFSCSNCSDGISIPEKYMSNIFHYINCNFKHQLTHVDFKWIGKYKYDFYLSDYNIIIETHGVQHYEENSNWDKLENVQKNDDDKLKLANENGYKLNENYFIIDCSSSDYEFLTEKIKRTLNVVGKLYAIDFSTIDYKECYIKSQTSIFHLVVKIANEHPKFTQQQILDNLKEKYGYQLHNTSVSKYLRKSNKLGLTNYKNKGKDKKTVIGVNIKNPTITVRYESMYGAEKDGFNNNYISLCCKGKRKSHKGYYWCYEKDYLSFLESLK